MNNFFYRLLFIFHYNVEQEGFDNLKWESQNKVAK